MTKGFKSCLIPQIFYHCAVRRSDFTHTQIKDIKTVSWFSWFTRSEVQAIYIGSDTEVHFLSCRRILRQTSVPRGLEGSVDQSACKNYDCL